MASTVRTTTLCALLVAPAIATAAAPAAADGARAAGTTGGAAYTPPVAPAPRASIVDGLASAPAGAPAAVRAVIEAGNRIVGLPYRYGGGHVPGFEDTAYDCSGAVSYALSGGGLLTAPLDSVSFLRWGLRGRGGWITVYTNPDHAYLQVAGIRLDTSAAQDPGGLKGARWRPMRTSNRGFRARHPLGL